MSTEGRSRDTTHGSVTEHSGITDEEWWYQLLCALADPKTIRVSLSREGEMRTPFTIPSPSYTKDFDDLVLDSEGGRQYITGGLVHGMILPLPAGEYHHYRNSGIMYATACDVARVSQARERYYKRLRYTLETEPDTVILHHNESSLYDIDVGENGSVLSFAASGGYFITASVYLDSRTVNGMGLGIYRPDRDRFSASSNMHTPPTNLVPLPRGYRVQLQVSHIGDKGFSYYRIHHAPAWW